MSVLLLPLLLLPLLSCCFCGCCWVCCSRWHAARLDDEGGAPGTGSQLCSDDGSERRHRRWARAQWTRCRGLLAGCALGRPGVRRGCCCVGGWVGGERLAAVVKRVHLRGRRPGRWHLSPTSASQPCQPPPPNPNPHPIPTHPRPLHEAYMKWVQGVGGHQHQHRSTPASSPAPTPPQPPPAPPHLQPT